MSDKAKAAQRQGDRAPPAVQKGSSTGQGPARKERRASGTMSRMLPNSGRCPTKRGRDSTSMEWSLTPARQPALRPG